MDAQPMTWKTDRNYVGSTGDTAYVSSTGYRIIGRQSQQAAAYGGSITVRMFFLYSPADERIGQARRLRDAKIDAVEHAEKNTPAPAAPALPAPAPGNAAETLVWSRRAESTGRYRVATIRNRSGRTIYRGEVVNGAAPVGHWHLRLRDAQAAVQQHHEELHRAHNTAAAMETARAAGDAQWSRLDGQRIDALTEDTRRTVRASLPRRELSGLGKLAASFRETHPAVR